MKNKKYIPMDTWIEENTEGLKEEIQCHLQAFEVQEPDVDHITDLIMLSVRLWYEERTTEAKI